MWCVEWVGCRGKVGGGMDGGWRVEDLRKVGGREWREGSVCKWKREEKNKQKRGEKNNQKTGFAIIIIKRF